MAKDFVKMAQELTGSIGKLAKSQPDMMGGFQSLMKASTADGALSTKTKELIALGIAIATRCDGCIAFHTQKLVKFGATKEEFNETLSMAVYMGGGPSLMYAAQALEAYEQFSQ
jgi:AhpD family alkylhydroperoxidase